MPNDHTRAIPQLEALEFVFPLGKQCVSLRDGLFIGKTGELLDSLDTPPAHEIASHAAASMVENGVGAFFGIDHAFALSSSTSTTPARSSAPGREPVLFMLPLGRRGSGARPSRSLDEIGQLSLENRPFNLVRVIALAIERRRDLREPRDATRSRQLKRAFDGGQFLIHAAGLCPIQGATEADVTGCADYAGRDPVAPDAAFTSAAGLFARPL